MLFQFLENAVFCKSPGLELCLLYCNRNEDLKQMLESNKDSAKLDAMKRIVGVGQMVKDFDFWKLSRL